MIETLKDQIDYEEHAIKEMDNGNAHIPGGWSVEKQRVFVDGMRHAYSIVTNNHD